MKLIGMVTKSQPVFVLMEFMGNGDLQNFLRKRRQGIRFLSFVIFLCFLRPGNANNLEVPTDSKVLQMAAEIADGMAYLESRKIIHRLLFITFERLGKAVRFRKCLRTSVTI